MKKRGSGLATVLVITAIMVTLAFTVVGLSFNHLSATTRMSNGVYAKDLAEAALAEAIDKVLQSNKVFGTMPGDSVNVTTAGAPAGSFGALTFDSSVASTWTSNVGLVSWRPSFNNLANQGSANSAGCIVPGQGVYLSAVGVCQGLYRRVETVIYIPQFPYAVAASGPINCGSNTYVSALIPGGNVSNPADLLPGSVASNSLAGSSALSLTGNNITVNGDVQSASGDSLSATNLTITGQTRLNANTVGLPQLNIPSYDTALQPGVQSLGTTVGSGSLSGYNRAPGNLTAESGLNLNGGVLYVNGNLNVNNGLSGTGAVIVNGTVNVTGTGSFSGTNKVALISQGDMVLTGENGNPAQYNGIIYSGKSISATSAQIQGTVVANDPSGTGGQISVTQSGIYQNNQGTNLTIPVTTPGAPGAVLPAGKPVLGLPVALGTNENYTGYISNVTATYAQEGNSTVGMASNASGANATGATNMAGMPTTTIGPLTAFSGFPTSGSGTSLLTVSLNVSAAINPTTTASRFWDPTYPHVVNGTATPGEYVAPVQITSNTIDPWGNSLTAGVYVLNMTTSPNPTYQPYLGSVPPLSANDYNVTVGPTSTSSSPMVASMSGGGWTTQATQAYVDALNNYAVNTLHRAPLSSLEIALATSSGSSTLSFSPLSAAALETSYSLAYIDGVRGTSNVTLADALPGFTPPATTSTSSWTLNLNNDGLIPIADQMRVLWWRDLQQ